MTKGRICYAESCITDDAPYESIRWSVFNDYAQQSMPGIMKGVIK